MLRTALLSLVLLSLLGTAAVGQDAKPISDAETVLAICVEDMGLEASGDPSLLICVWADGSMVWSGDQVFGGPPYYEATIDPNDVSRTMKTLDDIGVFDVPQLKRARFGPDAQYTSLLVRTEGRELAMTSWHEVYESSGKTVATDSGLRGLNGKKRLSVLAEESADYLHYRMAWLEIRLAAANLIPKDGDEAQGSPQKRHGKWSWQVEERASKAN